jgi:drug/metabolite transporter (DMT)-like permease
MSMPLLLAGAFLISFSSVCVKVADVGPTTAMFYRFLFGFVALGAVALWRKDKIWQGRQPMAWAIAGGVLFSLDLFFWHRSINYVGPGLATILANFQVFSLAVIGIVFMGEKLTWNLVVAIPASLVGLFMILGWDWSVLDATYRLGIIYGLITAASYTVLTLVLRTSQSLFKKLSPSVNMAWVCLIGGVVASVGIRPSGETFSIPNSQTVIALLAYGTLVSGLGWSFISKGLPGMPASRAGLVLILQPTLAFIWDVVFFARPTTVVQGIGAVLTVSAIYLGTLRRD